MRELQFNERGHQMKVSRNESPARTKRKVGCKRMGRRKERQKETGLSPVEEKEEGEEVDSKERLWDTFKEEHYESELPSIIFSDMYC